MKHIIANIRVDDPERDEERAPAAPAGGWVGQALMLRGDVAPAHRILADDEAEAARLFARGYYDYDGPIERLREGSVHGVPAALWGGAGEAWREVLFIIYRGTPRGFHDE